MSTNVKYSYNPKTLEIYYNLLRLLKEDPTDKLAAEYMSDVLVNKETTFEIALQTYRRAIYVTYFMEKDEY